MDTDKDRSGDRRIRNRFNVFQHSDRPQTIVDFRGYAVLLAVHFGGIYSGFIAAVLIAAARIALFGGPNLSAFIGAANVLFIALAGGLVLRSADKRYWSRWAKMMAVLLVTTGASIFPP